MTISAIETVYAGVRFRSRLEARWAVFFDAMGIPWAYEKEGFERTDAEGRRVRWLPDFEINAKPYDQWPVLVEVKGGDTALATDARRVQFVGSERDVLVLGDIPAPSFEAAGHNFSWGGCREPFWTAAFFQQPRKIFGTAALYVDPVCRRPMTVAPWYYPEIGASNAVNAAYTAARSERFGT